jgi:hypothetical protein
MTPARIQDAKAFLHRAGRPLELALCRYHFEHNPVAASLKELAALQMPDGGFRDMSDQTLSTPIGSTCAFQHLVDLHVGPDHPLVRRGVAYFIASYDAAHQTWQRYPAGGGRSGGATSVALGQTQRRGSGLFDWFKRRTITPTFVDREPL